MSLAKQGDKVRVHYTGKLQDGTVFGSSAERDPVEFTIGQGQLIPGFEQAVVGMNPGDSKNVSVDAEKAYGPRRDEMVVVMPKEKLPSDLAPDVGQQLQMQQPDGQVIAARVTDISDVEITLDANHPLAGKDLNFDLQLVEIV